MKRYIFNIHIICNYTQVVLSTQLVEAGIRELYEEVGIEVNKTELETSRILALWEVK